MALGILRAPALRPRGRASASGSVTDTHLRFAAHLPRRSGRTVVASAILLGTVGVSPSAAQTIMGRVVEDYTRKPLAGVPVTLERSDSAGAAGAAPHGQAAPGGVSAPDGVFVLVAPAPGMYRVRIGLTFAGPWMTLASADTVDQHEYVIATPAAGDGAASLVPGTFLPEYPDDLRGRRVAGEVVASVTVDTLGVPDMSTFAVAGSSHPLFTAAVRAALPKARFVPATAGGRKVRGVARIPASFAMQRGSDPPWRGVVDEMRKGRPPAAQP